MRETNERIYFWTARDYYSNFFYSPFKHKETADGVEFCVEGGADEDAQITVGLADETEYEVIIDGASIGKVKTNLGGKLNFSVDLSAGKKAVVIKK